MFRRTWDFQQFICLRIILILTVKRGNRGVVDLHNLHVHTNKYERLHFCSWGAISDDQSVTWQLATYLAFSLVSVCVIVLKRPNRTIYEIMVFSWLVIGTIPASYQSGSEWGQKSLTLTAALLALSYSSKDTISDLKSGHDHFLHQAAHNMFNERPEEQTKSVHLPCSADRNVHPSHISCRGLC
jgi:hypothetical protein